MERRQGFITSVYRSLMGSRHKTRRRQVTSIPPTPVTMESPTLATQIEPSSGKALEEDATQDEFGGKQQTTLEEIPKEESIPNNDLGEWIVVQVQQGSKCVPLIHTGTEVHEHLTNYFTKKINAKILSHSQSF